MEHQKKPKAVHVEYAEKMKELLNNMPEGVSCITFLSFPNSENTFYSFEFSRMKMYEVICFFKNAFENEPSFIQAAEIALNHIKKKSNESENKSVC